jgi:hypothetical protein
MAEAVLIGGAWDGHREQVTVDAEGLPPELIPRFRETTVYTEDTGVLPMRIPERGYRRRGPDPTDPSGTRWLYEPEGDRPG